MRKLTVLITGTAMLAILAGVAGATHSPGQGPKHDMAAGTLHSTIGDAEVDVHVNAKSGPLGQNAQGKMFIRIHNPANLANPDIEVRADVTCLNVVGNLATAAGPIERTDPEFPPGFQTLIISVQDFGSPGGGTPDRWSAQVQMTPPPTTCPTIPTFNDAEEGNVVVHDTP
jgi:hypothetical protein